MRWQKDDHPNEDLLHEYLDHALEKTTRDDIQAHLDFCAACSAQVHELEALFESLETMSERSLDRDLSPVVLAAIHSKRGLTPGFYLVSTLQIIGLGIVLMVAWPNVKVIVRELTGILFDDQVFVAASELGARVSDVWTSALSWLHDLLRIKFEINNWSGSSSSSPTLGWTTIILSLMLWLIFNRLLIRNFTDRSQSQSEQRGQGSSQ